MNNGVPESFQSMVFSRYVLRNGIVGSYGSSIFSFRASLVAQMVKRLPTMWETRVQSLDREDPLDKEMATHSSILAWKIPWMEDPGRLQSMGLQRVRHDWATALQGTSILFPIVAVSIYIPTSSIGRFPFVHTVSKIYCL